MENGNRTGTWDFYDLAWYPITKCQVEYPSQSQENQIYKGYISVNDGWPTSGLISLNAHDKPTFVSSTQYEEKPAETLSVSPSPPPSATPSPSPATPTSNFTPSNHVAGEGQDGHETEQSWRNNVPPWGLGQDSKWTSGGG